MERDRRGRAADQGGAATSRSASRPGLLDAEAGRPAEACGVDRVNHNLNTSRRFYPRICTTHAYDDRLDTLRAVRAAGMEICSGGIVGMGEEDADVVDLALRLGELGAEAIPVNFLIPSPARRWPARHGSIRAIA